MLPQAGMHNSATCMSESCPAIETSGLPCYCWEWQLGRCSHNVLPVCVAEISTNFVSLHRSRSTSSCRRWRFIPCCMHPEAGCPLADLEQMQLQPSAVPPWHAASRRLLWSFPFAIGSCSYWSISVHDMLIYVPIYAGQVRWGEVIKVIMKGGGWMRQRASIRG